MDGDQSEFLTLLEDQYNSAHQRAESIVKRARAEKRKNLNPLEERSFNDAIEERDALLARIDDAKSELARTGYQNPFLTNIRESGQAKTMTTTTTHDRESGVYLRGGENSYVRDLVRVHRMMDDGSSMRRLQQHAGDLERRAINRTDGTGGYFVPPAWLMSQWVALARPGRAFANLCKIAASAQRHRLDQRS